MTSIALALLSALLSVAIALSLAAARQALALRRAKRSGFLEAAAGTGAGFVLVVPPIVIGAGWFVLLRHSDYPLCRCPDHGRHRQRRHGHALRDPGHPPGLRRRRRTQRPALRATRHRRLEPGAADRLAGAAPADRHRLRLRHGAVARRSRRDRAVRQRFGPDVAVSACWQGWARIAPTMRPGWRCCLACSAWRWCSSPTVSARRGRLEREVLRHGHPPRKCALQPWRGRSAVRCRDQACGHHGRHGSRAARESRRCSTLSPVLKRRRPAGCSSAARTSPLCRRPPGRCR